MCETQRILHLIYRSILIDRFNQEYVSDTSRYVLDTSGYLIDTTWHVLDSFSKYFCTYCHRVFATSDLVSSLKINLKTQKIWVKFELKHVSCLPLQLTLRHSLWYFYVSIINIMIWCYFLLSFYIIRFYFYIKT
jgi:hypothetical protein